MVSFRDATMKQKLTWMSALASTIALLLASSAFFAYHLVTSRSFLARSLPIRADIIGLNSISSLRFNDNRSAEETLSALRADRNIVTAAIYSADGTVFATYAGHAENKAAIAPVILPEQTATARFEGRTLGPA